MTVTDQAKVETNSAKADKVSEREAKKKGRGPVRLKVSTLGLGGAETLGLLEYIAGKQDPEAGNLWIELFQACVDDPGEWYNRKFYYGEHRDSNSHSSIASMINKQGDIKQTAAEYKSVWLRKLRELVKIYGGEFQAEYTRETVPTDDPERGSHMNVVFVRFVKTPRKVAVKDAMAVHSSRRD